MPNEFDVIVVGAGHAGIEAALSAARMGRRVACITLNRSRIGHLPCNCSIGGPAKGHLVREVDALGGQMALTSDLAMTHIRRVGTGKGPAVQTLRAHVCKQLYPKLMAEFLANQPNLCVVEGTVETLKLEAGKASGVVARIAGEEQPTEFLARAIVLTTGTFLNGLCHRGKEKFVAARHGDPAVQGISAFLAAHGHELRRFKTGTTPRVRLSSLHLEGLERFDSEEGNISFLPNRQRALRERYACWQTFTNESTHEIIGTRLQESAMFSGQIQGTGPRYCPSIEDKVVRFADKDRHPVFLEIEEWDGESVYVQGFSSSLSAEVQLMALRSIEGLEDVDVLRYGYAVEYDMADPLSLSSSLMSKNIPGLFLAGQINGTSGYEEAAAQGLLAGINAGQYAKAEAPAILSRDQAFLGVMVDDLVTKGVEDPYRMLTARAEHRLLLRHDNADTRLTPLARELGLCSEERWARFSQKRERVIEAERALSEIEIGSRHREHLASVGEAEVDNKSSILQLLRRASFSVDDAIQLALMLDAELPDWMVAHDDSGLKTEALDQVELAAKFSGYLEIQRRTADRSRKVDAIKIPEGIDFNGLVGLSHETKEKLSRTRPSNLGQASRIPGVRPTDIALLGGILRQLSRPEPVAGSESD